MAILRTWDHCTVEVDGRQVSGSWAVEDGMVKVRTPKGEKATQIGSHNPTWLARRLLEELVMEGKA
jgi:hypothetical protein